MGRSGLCALLLLLLELAALTHPSPLHPICDARVMEKFIKEARDTENAMRQRQAAEVWEGQALLSAAVLRARDLVADPSLSQQLGRTYSNLRSVGQILRSHNAQMEPALPSAPPPTLSVRTLAKLLSIHSNFLRGRVKLFLTDACRPEAG
nr:erythropoietin isoform X2 [Pelodiscus sinensis]|eukprot:XP_014424831.1 erythropoietin isoform X2 [Pelodiscus sinensis]